MKWWPYYDGHHLLKGIDLLKLINEYNHDRVFNMLDELLIADSVYDSNNNGGVIKARASLNKDYGRIGITIDDEYARKAETGAVGGSIPEATEEDGYLDAIGIAPAN